MTNFEFWKGKLLEIVGEDGEVAIIGGVPKNCYGQDCNECDRAGKCDEAHLLKWLYEEHVEKPKLSKKERLFCELLEPGWIARDKDGLLHFYSNKPKKGNFVWIDGGFCTGINNYTFSEVVFEFIKFEDDEPWAVENLLKLEVED